MPRFIEILLLFLWSAGAWAQNVDSLVSLDFVEADIHDVARAVSLAYGVPILVDSDVQRKVTFHLEGLGLLEGLTALCESQELSLSMDGRVYHIRTSTDQGRFFFDSSDSGVTVQVQSMNIRDFVQNYSMSSGLNVMVAPGVEGRMTGNLQHLSVRDALRVLVEGAGFRLRYDGVCFWIEPRRTPEAQASGGIDIRRMGDAYFVELSDAPLRGTLYELAAAASLNLAIYGDIQETVRLKFDSVSLEQLLEALFRGSRYVYALDSTRLLVAEGGAKKALSKTELYPLKSVAAEKALQQLSKLHPDGDFVASEVKEQNALLLGGAPMEIEKAKEILRQVDVPTLQVMLSCIIVEFKRGKNFEIGFHHGATRTRGEYDLGARAFYDFLGKDLSKSGAFGKIGLLPDRFEVELSSLEENNEAEVLARPKLTTLNGNKAELNVTNTVYYLVSQVSAEGYPITDYRSFNDGISLELTPSVTHEGHITLDVSPEIKTAGRSSGDGPRDISTRNLKTTVVLKDGETLCLGGLVRKNTSEVRSAVPFLGSLPLVGRLFSYVSEVEEESELAIFITPEVVR